MTHVSKLINPLEIETTAGTQSRVSISQKVIDEYAEDLRNGDQFPDIVVFAEEGAERYILADGFHRLPAWIAVNKDKPIPCELREGTIWDAKIYAAGANCEHGVRRRQKDVRHAVKMLLLDGNSDGWADSVIATHARCDYRTVKNVREQLIIKGELDAPKTKKHVKDGKTVEKPVTKPKGTNKKDKVKDKPKKPLEPTKSQEEYDREGIVLALKSLDTIPLCSGAESLEKYKLHDQIELAERVADWLDDLISSSQDDGLSDDDRAFLEVV